MYSHSTRGTEVATTEGQWLLSKLPECSAPKTPDDSLKAHAHSSHIPPTLLVSITFVMSLNDVTIICFPFPVLYNILLRINQYNGSIAKNVIAKTMNRFGISHGYFIRSWSLHHPLVIASNLLDISNPHEYADICY